MTENATNEFCTPPERLRRLLDRGVQSDAYRGDSTGNVLCSILEYSTTDDRPTWHRAYLDLSDLITLAEHYVQDRVVEYRSAPHAEAFQALRNILRSMNLDSQWESYKGQLQPIVRLSLPFIVHSADPGGAVALIETSELEAIATEVRGLAEAVSSSDLPPLLKQQLSHHIAELLAALTRFQVAGIEGLVTKTAMVLATLTVQSKAAASRRDILDMTLSIATKMQDIILKTAGIYSLARPVVERLLDAG